MSQVRRGIVKWFDNRKGYGFLENPDGPDIFVHFSGIKSYGYRTVIDGERVYYELCVGPKGPYAANVVRSKIADSADSDLTPSLEDVPRFVLGQSWDDCETSPQHLAQTAEMMLHAHRW